MLLLGGPRQNPLSLSRVIQTSNAVQRFSFPFSKTKHTIGQVETIELRILKEHKENRIEIVLSGDHAGGLDELPLLHC